MSRESRTLSLARDRTPTPTLVLVSRASVAGRVCRVEFSSPRGEAWAYWHREVPAEGSTHDVEIDLPGEAIVGLKAAPDGANSPTVCVKPDGTIAVRCTAIGNDSRCVSLQFGDDVLLIETDLPAPPDEVPVVVESRSMAFYPINI